MKKFIKSILISTVAVSAVLTPYHIISNIYDSNVAAEVFSEENFSGGEEITVKEYKEKIGIFKSGSSSPYKTIDIYTFTLPCSDQLILKQGFLISENEIESVIEDYTG